MLASRKRLTSSKGKTSAPGKKSLTKCSISTRSSTSSTRTRLVWRCSGWKASRRRRATSSETLTATCASWCSQSMKRERAATFSAARTPMLTLIPRKGRKEVYKRSETTGIRARQWWHKISSSRRSWSLMIVNMQLSGTNSRVKIERQWTKSTNSKRTRIPGRPPAGISRRPRRKWVRSCVITRRRARIRYSSSKFWKWEQFWCSESGKVPRIINDSRLSASFKSRAPKHRRSWRRSNSSRLTLARVSPWLSTSTHWIMQTHTIVSVSPWLYKNISMEEIKQPLNLLTYC